MCGLYAYLPREHSQIHPSLYLQREGPQPRRLMSIRSAFFVLIWSVVMAQVTLLPGAYWVAHISLKLAAISSLPAAGTAGISHHTRQCHEMKYKRPLFSTSYPLLIPQRATGNLPGLWLSSAWLYLLTRVNKTLQYGCRLNFLFCHPGLVDCCLHHIAVRTPRPRRLT